MKGRNAVDELIRTLQNIDSELITLKETVDIMRDDLKAGTPAREIDYELETVEAEIIVAGMDLEDVMRALLKLSQQIKQL